MRGWAAFYDQPFLSYGSLSSINFTVVLDKINPQVWEDFEQFFVTKQGFLASKKYKNYSFEYNGYNVI